MAWQEAAQHNIQVSFNTLMLNQPGEAALALAADLAQFAAAVAALENCSIRCSACGNAPCSSRAFTMPACLQHALLWVAGMLFTNVHAHPCARSRMCSISSALLAPPQHDSALGVYLADPWAIRELFQACLMQMILPVVRTAAVTLQLAAPSSPQLCIACRCCPQVLPLRGSIRPARVCPCHGMPVVDEAGEGEHPSAA